MILSLDPSIATLGYAVVQPRPLRVEAIGLFETSVIDELDVSVSDAQRIDAIAGLIAATVRRHGITRIAAEQRLGYGAKRAGIAQALCWGALLGVAAALDLEVVEVVAKVWQESVVAGLSKLDKPDRYPKVERELAAFIGPRLDHLPKRKRNHPLDAGAVGIFAALRPHLCRVIRRAPAVHVERTEGAIA